MNTLTRFVRDQRGLETVEYAVMAGLIVGVSVALIIAIGGWVKNTYSTLQEAVE